MREIKFRGKHKDILGQECEWIYGSYLNPRDSCAAHFIADREIPGLTEVIPITVGQFTGLKDKNGTEIYEGDVVSYNTFRWVVMYNLYTASFQAVGVSGWGMSLEYDKYNPIEVIGNIFDNPELKERFWQVWNQESNE